MLQYKEYCLEVCITDLIYFGSICLCNFLFTALKRQPSRTCKSTYTYRHAFMCLHGYMYMRPLFLLLFTCYFQWNTNLTHSDFTCIEIDGRVFFYSERMLCEQALSLLQMCYKELGERNVFIKIITLVRLSCSNFWGTVPHHLLRDDWTAF